MNDPWIHRSKMMSCTTCMWYVQKDYIYQGKKPKVMPPILGRCRKHSPTMNGYPVVFPNDWCGDHKLDETK